MKRLIISAVAALFWCAALFSQTVTNVEASQEGNNIVVSYDIDKASPAVRMSVSIDGGKTFSSSLKKVSGDVKDVQPGHRRIVWDVLSEVEMFSGDNIVFNVVAESGRKNDNREYVDLGLSVKWATCNVGASKPEEYGNYYAWGESLPKFRHTSKVVKFQAGTNLNNSLQRRNTVMANWGGWRIPTNEEWEELINKCSWKKTELNGVVGYRVTSRIKGYTNNSIFLPIAGMLDDDFLFDAGQRGFYWSSSFLTISPDNAYCVCFDRGRPKKSTRDRRDGLSVRPVSEK